MNIGDILKKIDSSGENLRINLVYSGPKRPGEKSIGLIQWQAPKCLEGVDIDKKTLTEVYKVLIQRVINVN